MLTEILLKDGFVVPGESAAYIDYDTHESSKFKRLSRRWNAKEATEFVASLPQGKIVLKYPKASRVIDRWLELMPHARVIYVFRRRDEAVASNLKYSWRDRPLKVVAKWFFRWQWYRGLMAIANLPVPVAIVTFDELKKTKKFDIPANFDWS